MTIVINRAKTKQKIFSTFYNCFMILYDPAIKFSKSLAYVEYQKARAICECWNDLHPRKNISLLETCELAADFFNDQHNTDITPAKIMDDLTEIRKKL